jgi:hypothetical protein
VEDCGFLDRIYYDTEQPSSPVVFAAFIAPRLAVKIRTMGGIIEKWSSTQLIMLFNSVFKAWRWKKEANPKKQAAYFFKLERIDKRL